jgi:hypothetical protein
MKYDIDKIYSTGNKLEVIVNQTGSTAMIREKGQDEVTRRQGYRVVVNGDTRAIGRWNESREEVLLKAIKYESYAHLAYKELYYDLIQKLASIGFTTKEDSDD